MYSNMVYLHGVGFSGFSVDGSKRQSDRQGIGGSSYLLSLARRTELFGPFNQCLSAGHILWQVRGYSRSY